MDESNNGYVQYVGTVANILATKGAIDLTQLGYQPDPISKKHRNDVLFGLKPVIPTDYIKQFEEKIEKEREEREIKLRRVRSLPERLQAHSKSKQVYDERLKEEAQILQKRREHFEKITSLSFEVEYDYDFNGKRVPKGTKISAPSRRPSTSPTPLVSTKGNAVFEGKIIEKMRLYVDSKLESDAKVSLSTWS